MRKPYLLLQLYGLMVAAAISGRGEMEFPAASPKLLGLSSERIETMRAFHQSSVDAGEVAGAVTILARHGAVADWRAYGYADIEAGRLMAKDSIFAIYSMSKTITSVAVMMLVEEGRVHLQDPIEMHIPQLDGYRVYLSGDADNPELAEPKRPVTVKDLLVHTSGWGYSFTLGAELRRIYERPENSPFNAADFEDFIARTRDLPLAHQPGDQFTYGISTDILGYLVEAASGQPFEDFLRERVFEPLEMVDTSFVVPPEKRERVALIYTRVSDGGLERRESQPALSRTIDNYGWPSGGGGLFSTAGDYLRFAQMLLDKGRVGERHLLGKKTVERMMTNQLTAEGGPRHPFYSDFLGYAIGGSIHIDAGRSPDLLPPGSFVWGGAASTFYVIEPSEQLIGIYMTQFMPTPRNGFQHRIYNLFYQTIVE